MQQLVSDAASGNVEAFQELYRLYGKKILNFIYRMTSSREEAEDLTQDTFILAYKNLATLKETAKFQSWLFRIAQNNVYQKYRGKQPQIESIDQDDSDSHTHQLASQSKDPEDQLLSGELKRVVENAINQLPDKYKNVFVLSAIQKLSYKEISSMVGRSLASVKSDIHRARVEVRDAIKEYQRNRDRMSNTS